MIKSELVARIAERHPNLYHRDAETVVNAVLGEIAAALARGDRVEIRGFGAFSVKKRDARDGRNPRTGDAVAVAEKAVPAFKAGKDMRERLNAAAANGAEAAPRGRRAAPNKASAKATAAATTAEGAELGARERGGGTGRAR